MENIDIRDASLEELGKYTDMIGKRRDDHKNCMNEVTERMTSLSERAIEIENSNLTEEEMLKELEKIQKEYLNLNKNYKEEMNAIHTYNGVIRRTKDEVISRKNSEEREITVNPEPEQEFVMYLPFLLSR